MKIMYTRDDGGVSIVIPSPNFEGSLDELAKTVPEGVGWEAVDDVPTDRTFRDAWKANGKSIGVDMEKARGIHMGRIRKVRDAKLEELDIEQLKGNDVSAEKQRLRDIPQTFDLTTAQTPDELKALWPEGL